MAWYIGCGLIVELQFVSGTSIRCLKKSLRYLEEQSHQLYQRRTAYGNGPTAMNPLNMRPNLPTAVDQMPVEDLHPPESWQKVNPDVLSRAALTQRSIVSGHVISSAHPRRALP
ncbi:hypothetical protein C8R42DRAFT_680978 [Lentinula raphanica]|nr:hypothetical protein C8R42DRAFT_680978 [Lentinula raphanica]